MPSYPTDTQPGIGGAAFEILAHMPDPTLVITKRRSGTPVTPPDHVRLVRIPYWEMTLGAHKGISRFLRLGAKFLGYLMFGLLSFPYMITFRPNIVHIHTPMPIFHGLFGKYGLRTRLYISFHGSDASVVARSLVLRFLVRRAHVICIVSEAMRSIIEPFAPRPRVFYTPNGVDTEAFPYGVNHRQSVICMVGSLRWQKDYPTAIHAFHRFRRQFSDWELIIVGEGPDRDRLIALTADLHLQSAVHFKGMQSREEVAALMRSSKLFLLSSVSEGFPKVVLEATSSGTPIVVTDVGSCREIAELSGGQIVSPNQPIEMAEALAAVAKDKVVWQNASEKGRSAARCYQWATTAQSLREHYRASLASE